MNRLMLAVISILVSSPSFAGENLDRLVKILNANPKVGKCGITAEVVNSRFGNEEFGRNVSTLGISFVFHEGDKPYVVSSVVEPVSSVREVYLGYNQEARKSEYAMAEVFELILQSNLTKPNKLYIYQNGEGKIIKIDILKLASSTLNGQRPDYEAPDEWCK